MHLKEEYVYYICCVMAVVCLAAALVMPKGGSRKSVTDDLRAGWGKSENEKKSKHEASGNKSDDGKLNDGEANDEKSNDGESDDREANDGETAGEIIRVLLRGDGFREELHQSVGVCAPGGLIAEYDGTEKETAPGEIFSAAAGAFPAGGCIRIRAKQEGEKITVTTFTRGYGTPSYNGMLELIPTADGIALINELPLEQYLYGVVPSEMPSFYEMEALKCQAVAARSYVYNQMKTYAYPQYMAHVDDSVAFQVYGNSETKDTVIQAVNETAGKKLWFQGQVATAYYFSTSAGQTTDLSAWGQGDCAYLQSVRVGDADGDYEASLPWYRWEAAIPAEMLSELISRNTGTKIGKLRSLCVTKRGAGNAAIQITAEGSLGSVTVDTENKIRRALGGSGYQIQKNDGTAVPSKELLPSAFFTIEEKEQVYVIRGGGYGHGIGMSQNGANEMAKRGMNCEEILKTFYAGVSVEESGKTWYDFQNR